MAPGFPIRPLSRAENQGVHLYRLFQETPVTGDLGEDGCITEAEAMDARVGSTEQAKSNELLSDGQVGFDGAVYQIGIADEPVHQIGHGEPVEIRAVGQGICILKEGAASCLCGELVDGLSSPPSPCQ